MTVQLLRPDTTASWGEAPRLAEEYASPLNLDLSFQNFANEIEHLPTEYGPPKGAFYWPRRTAFLSGALDCANCLRPRVRSSACMLCLARGGWGRPRVG
jgi:hypothetical protein